MISIAVARFFELVLLLLFITILLTWVPSIKWEKQPFVSLKAFSEIFLSPFRKLIPPVGAFDFSPIVAFFVLKLIGGIIVSSLKDLGL